MPLSKYCSEDKYLCAIYYPKNKKYSRLMKWEDADKIYRSIPGVVLIYMQIIATFKLAEDKVND